MRFPIQYNSSSHRSGLPSASVKFFSLLLAGILFACSVPVHAQVEDLTQGLGDAPIEITSSQGTRFVDGKAVATGDVKIFTEDASLFADNASYDTTSKDVTMEGNVRIYRGEGVFIGDSAIYNLESKQIRADEFGARYKNFVVFAKEATANSDENVELQQARLTTHDSSKPDYHFRAKKVRIKNGENVVFSDVTLFVGQTPVFWLPYLYQPLDEAFSFSVSPGFSDTWGAFLLTEYAFPITEKLNGEVSLDLFSKRGVAFGGGLNYQLGDNPLNLGYVDAWFLENQDPNYNPTTIPRPPISSGRYRLSGQQQLWFTESLDLKIQAALLSDAFVLQDFFQTEFSLDPQPPTYAVLTQKFDTFAVSLTGRAQVNDFLETTERLPELAIDFTRLNVFGTRIFYEGTTSIAHLRRDYADTSIFTDFDTTRFDTFHQFSLPGTYFGWLNMIPRAGFRGTYYENTALQRVPLVETGQEFRPVLNTGLEMSFKATRTFDNVDIKSLGLDGLRHVIQPYTDYSFVRNFGFSPAGQVQFDRRVPNTEIDLIEFPDFTAIDSIDSWNIMRVGVRNRLQTKRDRMTVNWLEFDSYFNVNIDNPYSQGRFSNFFNVLRFQPVPWAAFSMKSQIPLTNQGFTEINTQLSFMATKDLDLAVGHRYLNDNPFFPDSSLLRFRALYRLNDHWSFSALEQWEIADNTLETQMYSVHRDLTSWMASFGAVIRDNGGKTEFGMMMTFTLKDLPQVSLPVSFDPGFGSQQEN